MTNVERVKRERAELAEDPTLNAVAKAHSEAMARKFDELLAKGIDVAEAHSKALKHDVGEGSFVDRLRAAAPNVYQNSAEAISSGYRERSSDGVRWTVVPYSHSPSQTVRGWLTSTKGHREDLLDPDFTRHGVGVAYGKGGVPFVTQVYGRT